MKNLAELPKSEQLAFINSFDHVLSDLDGVMWLQYKPIPGASECMNILKKNGKLIHFVSNNSTNSIDVVKEKLNSCGFDAQNGDIVTPIIAILSHLKEIEFSKPLYVIASNSMKDLLRDEGLTVVEGPQVIEESIPSLLSQVNDDGTIGAVLVEFDLNVNYIKLQKAVTYLRREDCLFITGGGDARIPFGLKNHLIGPHYYMKPLIDLSGREPYQIAKPSLHYNDYIVKRYRISDPTRVLFIGDSITEDLNFATKCGYQKLLVLTGITNKDHLSNWDHPEEYKPQYYVENLNVLHEIVCNCTGVSNKK
ncbi:4-nitrophenylphosphatase-like [Anoplophora glabripennis]|uniref:4-nitrophenylphosphatase-like n=1 Tax=Anoplophora glabripennis TaxID=217634 RepID=UPI0008740D96|nr:4-nitrophenylphosphatase-like [Anoplophora glabripennis]